MEHFTFYIDYIAKIMEAIGVLTIFCGALYSFFIFFKTLSNKEETPYVKFRQTLGKSILLGLEILIAADIMATVVTDPTLRSVSILAIIVIIRTFLSMSLQVELEGRFPWQKKKNHE
ncbi:MAG: DUF1622 domain-containing protein [Aquaticitalea sp.]